MVLFLNWYFVSIARCIWGAPPPSPRPHFFWWQKKRRHRKPPPYGTFRIACLAECFSGWRFFYRGQGERFSHFLQGRFTRFARSPSSKAMMRSFVDVLCFGIAYEHLKNDKESIWARTVPQPKHERRSDENVKEPLPRHFFAFVFCCRAKNEVWVVKGRSALNPLLRKNQAQRKE
jgi:hypothetical protein